MEGETVNMLSTIIENATTVATGYTGILTKFTTWITSDPIMSFVLGVAVVAVCVSLLFRFIKSISLG